MNRYNDVMFLPLDVPPIPNKSDILETFKGNEHYAWWKQEVLLGERPPPIALGSVAESWTESASDKYPALIEHIHSHLPFERLCYVRIARAKGNVPAHVDENYEVAPLPHHRAATKTLIDHQQRNEPVGYRFVISGSRDSLYLSDCYDPSYKTTLDEKKQYCTIPTDSDFFLIHNSKQPHGVSARPDQDDDRLIGFLLGFLDETKHMDLIERSLERFSKIAIFRKDLQFAVNHRHV